MSLGSDGEALACRFLEKKGYELIKANFRYNRAEIDLIMKDEKGKQLIFVEVKTRRNKSFGEPQEAVTELKQLQLIKSAEGFLMDNLDFADYEKRFDVVAIYIENGKENINHLENAF